MSPKTKFAIGFILLLAYYALVAPWWNLMPPTPKPIEWSPEEKAQVTKKLKYHGISGCIQDETGTYFFRGGRRVKL